MSLSQLGAEGQGEKDARDRLKPQYHQSSLGERTGSWGLMAEGAGLLLISRGQQRHICFWHDWASNSAASLDQNPAIIPD